MRTFSRYAVLLAVLTASSYGISRLLAVRARVEKQAQDASRTALRVQQLGDEVEFFMNRRFRSVQNFVLLSDEAEKLQDQQGAQQTASKLESWREWTKERGGSSDDWLAMNNAHRRIAALEKEILGLMDDGRRTEAMERVQGKFLIGLNEVQGEIKAVKGRLAEAVTQSDRRLQKELQQTRWWLIGTLAGTALLVGALAFALIGRKRSRKDEGEAAMRVETTPPAPPPLPRPVPRTASPTPSVAQEAPSAPPPPPAPKPEAPPTPTITPPDFEDTVEGFRELLIQMAAKPPDEKSKKN